MDVRDLSEIPPWEWPEDADEVLLDALRDRAAADDERMLAAELAASVVVIDDDVARALLEVVRGTDEEPELRGRAAIALGRTLEEQMMARDTGDPEDRVVSDEVEAAIRTTFRNVYIDPETPKLVRRRALEASIRGSEEWHEGAIRAAYHDGDPEWRLTAVFCMGFLPGFEPEIVEALEGGDDRVRFEALRAAGRMGVTEAWPHVRDVLRAPADRDWLLAAIEAAGPVSPEEAPAALAPYLDSDDDEILEAANDALEWARILSGDHVPDDPDEPPPPRPFGNGDGGLSSGW